LLGVELKIFFYKKQSIEVYRLLLFLLSLSLTLSAQQGAPAKEFPIKELPKILQALLEQHNGNGSIDEDLAIASNSHFFAFFDPNKIYLLNKEIAPFTQKGEGKEFAQRLQNSSFSTYFEMLEICQKALKRAKKIRSRLHIKNTLPNFETHASNEDELRSRLSLLSEIPLDHEKLWLSLSPTGKTSPKLARLILKSIVATFDMHSKVLDTQQARSLRERLTKEGVGTGIVAKRANGSWKIEQITKGSPADQTGILKQNDILLSIDHLSCFKMSQEEIDEHLHGAKQKNVRLRIGRGSTTFSTSVPSKLYVISDGRVSLQRRSTAQGAIAVVSIPTLYRGSMVSTENDMQKGIGRAETKGALSGLILDLRGNPGGYISEAADVVGLFVSTGVVASALYQDKTEWVFRDLNPKVIYRGPIVVLISHTTASSAEVIAQALVDYGKAIIVGDAKSCGKGTVQMQTVTRSSGVALPMKMTVGKMYTVSGHSLHGKGVSVDIAISNQPPSPLKKEAKEYEDIAPRFNDRLQDLKKERIPWYIKAYLPYLQRPTKKYRSLLPQIQREYERRSKRPSSLYFQTENQDRQLEEAVLILQDLIRLSKQ